MAEAVAGEASKFRDESGVLWGAEVPRIFTPPLRELTPETSLGFEVIDFAEQVLLIDLFPWQRFFLIHALELLEDGSPRFRTLVLMIARQSGKTLIVQVLTLWAIFMRAALVGGVAQKEDVAKEIWRDALQMAQDREWLAPEIVQVVTANGSVQFRLSNGGRYKISAGGRKAFRGMTIDGFAIIDELREQVDWGTWGAITSTTKATRTGQVVAMSNAGDAASVVLRSLRDQALESIEDGSSDTHGHFEYSAPEDCDKYDRDGWAMANPSLSWNPALTERSILAEAKTAPEDVFRMEQLCQWWTRSSESIFPGDTWLSKMDPNSFITDDSPLVLSVAAWQKEGTIGRASICAAGLRPDGDRHVEVISARPGLDWVVDKVVKDFELSGAESVVIQARGAVASRCIQELRDRGVNVFELSGGDITIAHGSFYQSIIADEKASKRTFHIGQENLTLAANEAQIKPLGGQWVFDLNHDIVDVTPVVGCAQALHGLEASMTTVRRRSAYDDGGGLLVV